MIKQTKGINSLTGGTVLGFPAHTYKETTMPEPKSLQERIAVIETKLETHIEITDKRFDELRDGQDAIKESIDRFEALLNKAAGIRWFVGAGVIVAGWFGGIGDWVSRHLLR